jgi:hypothetical protein
VLPVKCGAYCVDEIWRLRLELSSLTICCRGYLHSECCASPESLVYAVRHGTPWELAQVRHTLYSLKHCVTVLPVKCGAYCVDEIGGFASRVVSRRTIWRRAYLYSLNALLQLSPYAVAHISPAPPLPLIIPGCLRLPPMSSQLSTCCPVLEESQAPERWPPLQATAGKRWPPLQATAGKRWPPLKATAGKRDH